MSPRRHPTTARKPSAAPTGSSPPVRMPPYQCLFCRQNDSFDFTRVEHPIPESLGNDNETLPAGFVCDTCNQYFGSKIEARMLAAPPFNIERTAQAIRTKKRKLPTYVDHDFVLASTGCANTVAF